MRFMVSAVAVATAFVSGQAFAQAPLTVPEGGKKTAPVPQAPPADPADSPEEIAKDAARDLKDSRFYNRPGATRAQYDADWQECRLIARGSRTPSGSVPFFYNPAVISPVAAGIAGGLGGAIGAAIAEGQQRRDNRRSCLLIRGWRLVEVPAAEATRVAAMTDADRDSYFNALVGAETVKGEVTERTSFALAEDPALKLATPLAAPGSVWLGKKVDPAAPLALAANEGAIVVGFRRVEPAAVGRSATVELLRYDRDARDVLYRPRDWKKRGDTTTYGHSIASRDKTAAYEAQVIRLTPGDYVINATAVGAVLPMSTNCFGAPTFRVEAGQVLYLGDFVPYLGAKLADGSKISALAYTTHIDDARRTLARTQTALATAMTPATVLNRATYGCSGIAMTRWDLPGMEALPDRPAVAVEPAAAAPATVTAATP